MSEHRWFWLDTGWGCGAVVLDTNDVVVDCAPIFKKRFLGDRVSTYKGKYQLEPLSAPGEHDELGLD